MEGRCGYSHPFSDAGGGDQPQKELIRIISSTYDSVNGQFQYMNARGVYGAMATEKNSFFREVKEFISATVIPAAYDTAQNWFQYANQKGWKGTHVVENNPFFSELGNYISVMVTSDFGNIAVEVREGV